MSEKRFSVEEIRKMTPKSIVELLNCKQNIIEQQNKKLMEIRLILDYKMVDCENE